MTAFENKLRVWVSRHNAASGESWKVSADGERKFELYLPVGATTTKPVAPATPRKTTNVEVNAGIAKQNIEKVQAAIAAAKVEAAKIEHPTKPEFLAYLATIKPGQEFTLAANYAHRFIEMVDWLLEFDGEPFEYSHNETAKTLTIKRKVA